MRKVQILGAGCAKCHRLFENARQASVESAVSCDITKVTDILEMLAFNVIGLPALAIDGQVKAARRVPSPGEIKSWLVAASGVKP